MLGYVFGHPTDDDQDFEWYDKRVRNLLFLSATPFEEDYAAIQRQLEIFGFGDAPLSGPDGETPRSVRALVEDRLESLRTRAWTLADRNDRESPHYRQLAGDLQRFLDERKWEGPTGWRPAPTPPGSPIGAGTMGGGCGG